MFLIIKFRSFTLSSVALYLHRNPYHLSVHSYVIPEFSIPINSYKLNLFCGSKQYTLDYNVLNSILSACFMYSYSNIKQPIIF